MNAPSGGTLHDFRLMLITDPEACGDRDLRDVVETALSAGLPMLQLRDKNVSAHALLAQVREYRELCDRFGARLIVNDRLDVALAGDADGVHLGPDDIPIKVARECVSPGFLIGYSCDDPESARQALEQGADYIGCGAIFATDSKGDAGEAIGVEGLRRVVEAVDIPVLGIGGITLACVGAAAESGCAGVAVIRGVLAEEDPGGVVREMLGGWGSVGTR